MTEKRLIIAGIILALLVMVVCGLGLYRNTNPRYNAIDATIVISDTAPNS